MKREFAFLLDAWIWCQQHGIDNWRDRVKRKNWETWVIVVPEMSSRYTKLKANT